MSEITPKLELALESKKALKAALISKGADVTENTPLAKYADKINEMEIDPTVTYAFSTGTYGGYIFSIGKDAYITTPTEMTITIKAASDGGEHTLKEYVNNGSSIETIDLGKITAATTTFTARLAGYKSYKIEVGESAKSSIGVSGTITLEP